jgi:hypothetical protein
VGGWRDAPHEPTLAVIAQLSTQAARLRRGRVALWLAVALGIAAALGVRAYHIDQPPIGGFAAPRQYHGAHLARWYYVKTQDAVPEWRKQVARRNADDEGIVGDPPVMEFAAAAAYRVVGGEQLWIPRLLASLWWLAGGAFLYLIARRLAPAAASLCSLGVYLFLPFAVSASRSFQPDPMVVALLLAGALAVLRYHEEPGLQRLLIAGVVSALAVLAKPGVALFPLLGAFVGLSVAGQGMRRMVRDRRLWAFVALVVSPAALYLLWGIVLDDFLRGATGGRIVPGLLDETSYWRGWGNVLMRVLGATLLAAALVGVVLARGRGRGLLVGLWAGYVLYGLAFTYHIHTHEYYSLPLVPIAALSLAPLVAVVLTGLRRLWLRRRAVVVAGATVGAVVVGLDAVQAYERLTNEPVVKDRVAAYEAIGRDVRHSRTTIILDYSYGAPVKYHGWFSGAYWPTSSDIFTPAVGEPQISARERFRRYWPDGSLAEGSPEYFVVTDLADLDRQRDLRRLLRGSPVVRRTQEYVVYDVRSLWKTTGPG